MSVSILSSSTHLDSLCDLFSSGYCNQDFVNIFSPIVLNFSFSSVLITYKMVKYQLPMLHTISYKGNKIYTVDRRKGSALKFFSVLSGPWTRRLNWPEGLCPPARPITADVLRNTIKGTCRKNNTISVLPAYRHKTRRNVLTRMKLTILGFCSAVFLVAIHESQNFDRSVGEGQERRRS